MSRLKAAMDAAEARKQASLGDTPGIVVTDSELADRAIFSGFDVEYEEINATAHEVGHFFLAHAGHTGLYQLFVASWIDGLLVGLLAANLPPDEPESSDPAVAAPNDSGSEGEICPHCGHAI